MTACEWALDNMHGSLQYVPAACRLNWQRCKPQVESSLGVAHAAITITTLGSWCDPARASKVHDWLMQWLHLVVEYQDLTSYGLLWLETLVIHVPTRCEIHLSSLVASASSKAT